MKGVDVVGVGEVEIRLCRFKNDQRWMPKASSFLRSLREVCEFKDFALLRSEAGAKKTYCEFTLTKDKWAWEDSNARMTANAKAYIKQ